MSSSSSSATDALAFYKAEIERCRNSIQDINKELELLKRTRDGITAEIHRHEQATKPLQEKIALLTKLQAIGSATSATTPASEPLPKKVRSVDDSIKTINFREAADREISNHTYSGLYPSAPVSGIIASNVPFMQDFDKSKNVYEYLKELNVELIPLNERTQPKNVSMHYRAASAPGKRSVCYECHQKCDGLFMKANNASFHITCAHIRYYKAA